MTAVEAQPRRSRARRLLVPTLLTAGMLAVALAMALLAPAESWFRPEPPPPLDPDWTASALVLAGDGTIGWRDGVAATARFSDPFGVAVAPDGAIVIADGGEAHRIRVLTPDGFVFTLAGGTRGFMDGRGGAARFDTPSGVALDATGAIYVADTANNAIRRVSPEGDVTTVAGTGAPGFADGPSDQARFNGPIGVAVDRSGRILVADTYNDRIRVIDSDGMVTTLAGGGEPGWADGFTDEARFNSPSGIAVAPDGRVVVADTGNGALRQIDADGRETTSLDIALLARPAAVAVGHDGEIYVTDDRGWIQAINADGAERTLAGGRSGFRDGAVRDAAFRRPSGLAVLGEGRLVVADTGNALVRLVAEPLRLGRGPPVSPRVQPGFDADGFGWMPLLWPVQPWEGPHEIAGTLGEARGARAERLHNGVDVRIEQGTPVHAVRDGVVESPIAAGAFGTLNEWIRIGSVAYVHVRVGRTRGGRLFDPARFVPNYDQRGRLAGIRVKRGARFRSGEAIASVNSFNHVHLSVGWSGEEHNPLQFRLVNFVDTIPPTIPAGGVRLYDAVATPLTDRVAGRLVVSGQVRVVVDAWDQAEGNRPGRRLGLYALGYQVLLPDGGPASGFETENETIRFDRFAGDRTAAHLIFAPGSGIPFYSGGRTRFLYTVTNTLRAGIASEGYWDTTRLPPGDYTLRVWAEDAARNRTEHDVGVTIVRDQASPSAAATP